jgi:hypothetical protein
LCAPSHAALRSRRLTARRHRGQDCIDKNCQQMAHENNGHIVSCADIVIAGTRDEGSGACGGGRGRPVDRRTTWVTPGSSGSPQSCRPGCISCFLVTAGQLSGKPSWPGVRPTPGRGEAAVVPRHQGGVGERLVPAVTWISSLQKLGYQGLPGLDIRLDPHHGECNLLACNPRPGRGSGSPVTLRAPAPVLLLTST